MHKAGVSESLVENAMGLPLTHTSFVDAEMHPLIVCVISI